jgi:hypothetical protein
MANWNTLVNEAQEQTPAQPSAFGTRLRGQKRICSFFGVGG